MLKTLLATCLIVVLASPAFPQPDMPGPMESHEHLAGMGPMDRMEMGPMDRMGDMMGMCLDNAATIGLTQEQKNRLTPLHREMKKKQVRYKADAKLAEMELMEIMEVKDFDLEKASAATRKISDIKTAYHLDMLKLMKEVRTTLTDEQFQKLLQLKHRKMEKREMKKERKKPVKKMGM